MLTDKAVADIGMCRMRARGNIIKWEESKFKLYNITKDKIEDISKLCIPEETFFVLPEKSSLALAISLCKYHGGYLYSLHS